MAEFKKLINPPIKASEINSESATSGQVLQADGNGGASWQTPSGGGGGGTTLYTHYISVANYNDTIILTAVFPEGYSELYQIADTFTNGIILTATLSDGETLEYRKILDFRYVVDEGSNTANIYIYFINNSGSIERRLVGAADASVTDDFESLTM